MVDRETQFLQAHDDYADAIFRYCYYRVFDREKAKDYTQEIATILDETENNVYVRVSRGLEKVKEILKSQT